MAARSSQRRRVSWRRLIFGRGEIASLTRHIPEGVRVLVTFGGGSVKRNGVYDQVKAALAGIDHVEFWFISELRGTRP